MPKGKMLGIFMGVLDDMAQQARSIAASLKANISSKEKMFERRKKELEAQFQTQLATFLDNYKTDADVSDAAKTAMEHLNESVLALVSDIQNATRDIGKQITRVDGMVTGLQTTITNIEKTTDFDALDGSSKQLLLDFSKEYKSAYAIVWAKVILVAFLVYYLRKEWILVSVLYVAVYVSWGIINALITIAKGIFKKRGAADLKGANVTADAVGCPPAAPQYKPCSASDFGCCADGLAAPADKSTCGTLDCWNTAFGCCLNGSVRTSATDKCDVPVECGDAKYGCCPNGMPRDAAGSSCSMTSPCGFSAFGCCSDGTERVDKLGSNCVGAAPESPLQNLNRITSTELNVPFPELSITPPNPFTKSGFSFRSGLQAIS